MLIMAANRLHLFNIYLTVSTGCHYCHWVSLLPPGVNPIAVNKYININFLSNRLTIQYCWVPVALNVSKDLLHGLEISGFLLYTLD